MDFEFIREQTPLYIEAAKLTLHMAVIGVLLAIVVGLVCSMVNHWKFVIEKVLLAWFFWVFICRQQNKVVQNN